jgi:hypothetical protein
MARIHVWLPVAAAAFLAVLGRAGADPEPELPSRRETFSMVDQRDFAKLEQITGPLRDSRLGFYNGWPLMYRFYQSLSFATTDEGVWQRYIDDFSEWQAEFPESPTPAIALADLYRDYAWQARGDGMGDTVTADGWRLFAERLKKAQAILDKVRALKVQDAGAYLCQISVSKGLGQPRAAMEDAFSRGVAIDPDYLPLYSAKANFLMPKWYGKPGDWEHFAAEAADKRGGDEGDVLYMYIVRSVSDDYGQDLFKNPLVSYPRMKKGFIVSRSLYPTNGYDLNCYCYFSSIAGDNATASGLFGQIGEQIDENVWGSAQNFHYWKNRVSAAAVLEKPAFNFRTAAEICGGVVILVLACSLIVVAGRLKAAPPQPPVL